MRASWDEHYTKMARLVAEMGTCARRQVGCVLVDKKNRILATGHNGVPPGWPHCSDGHSCPGADARSGESLDLCWANHGEANALLQCRDVWQIRTCYVTVSPCISCMKLLLCTGCTRIVFIDEYPNAFESLKLWNLNPPLSGREWIHYPLD